MSEKLSQILNDFPGLAARKGRRIKSSPARVRVAIVELMIAWRAFKQLTQMEAANALEVPYKTYEKWESGDMLPTGKNLEKLQQFFNFPGKGEA